MADEKLASIVSALRCITGYLPFVRLSSFSSLLPSSVHAVVPAAGDGDAVAADEAVVVLLSSVSSHSSNISESSSVMSFVRNASVMFDWFAHYDAYMHDRERARG